MHACDITYIHTHTLNINNADKVTPHHHPPNPSLQIQAGCLKARLSGGVEWLHWHFSVNDECVCMYVCMMYV